MAVVRYPAHTADGPGVEVHGVNDPGDRRHDLLWIVPPPAAPGMLAPDGAHHHPERPEREADQHHAEGEVVQCLGIGQPTRGDLEPAWTGGGGGGAGPFAAERPPLASA